jgi:hypothetical protein
LAFDDKKVFLGKLNRNFSLTPRQAAARRKNLLPRAEHYLKRFAEINRDRWTFSVSVGSSFDAP